MRTQEEKQALFQQVKEIYDRDYSHLRTRGMGGCFYWTVAGMRVLMPAKVNILPQAGTLSWPIVSKEDDDGVSATHFTYLFNPHHEASVKAMIAGYPPEMHVWLADLDERSIVDFSTGELKEVALRTVPDLKWRMPDPPPFLWGVPPKRTVYEPSRSAIAYFAAFVKPLLTDL